MSVGGGGGWDADRFWSCRRPGVEDDQTEFITTTVYTGTGTAGATSTGMTTDANTGNVSGRTTNVKPHQKQQPQTQHTEASAVEFLCGKRAIKSPHKWRRCWGSQPIGTGNLGQKLAYFAVRFARTDHRAGVIIGLSQLQNSPPTAAPAYGVRSTEFGINLTNDPDSSGDGGAGVKSTDLPVAIAVYDGGARSHLLTTLMKSPTAQPHYLTRAEQEEYAAAFGQKLDGNGRGGAPIPVFTIGVVCDLTTQLVRWYINDKVLRVKSLLRKSRLAPNDDPSTVPSHLEIGQAFEWNPLRSKADLTDLYPYVATFEYPVRLEMDNDWVPPPPPPPPPSPPSAVPVAAATSASTKSNNK